jgi:hypothetical protein
MKYPARSVLLPLALLFIGSLGTTLAQLTTTGVELAPNYDSLVPPPAGATYSDPVFGSTIKRVSNAQATPNASGGGYLTWIENEYSTMSAFNTDNSKFILVHQSYFGLYDGPTGAYMYALPLEIIASSEPRWSRKDNVTLYYHSGNQLKSYNISTGGISVVHTFSEYTAISGNGEMDISLDGDHFVFVGDNEFVFVYQISTDKKFGVFDAGAVNFDSVYITPDNNVILSWYTVGTARYTGQELFDINMNFLRQVGHADGHKDVTSDANGDEVLIWTNSADPQPIANCQNGIVKIRLADATQTCLLQLGWSLAVHISAPDGNGTVFVDTEAPSNPESGSSGWVSYTDELLQIKLDGSGATRLAHHRSRPVNSYNWEPKLSTSRDGTRLLFASNYDLSNIEKYPVEYSDTYLMVLNGSTAASSSPNTSTPTPSSPTPPPSNPTPPSSSTVIQYEEDNPAVQYTGTWYPNYGAFNIGGSATMAMDANSQAQLTFTGTGVQWIGFSDPWSGVAQVYVDGTLRATVDTFSATQQAQAVQYSVSNLNSGSHTLTIVATGNHSSGSAGSWVWVNAFDVTTSAIATTTAIRSPPANRAADAVPSNPVRTK